MSIVLEYFVVSRFFQGAAALRRYFEEYFGRPYQLKREDFVWTFWYVPNRYVYLKTPARLFFPAPLFGEFRQFLEQWSRTKLGMVPMGEPMLSLYVNGCGQGPHNDAGNGRFGYVFSLTNWQRHTFQGGETLIHHRDGSNYWRSGRFRAAGSGELVRDAVPARFNQLTVFDDRLIHEVAPLQGSMNPLLGRLVMHGHLLEAEPFASSPCPPGHLARLVGLARERYDPLVCQLNGANGVVCLRLAISASGRVRRVRTLCNTALSSGGEPLLNLPAQLRGVLRKARFPAGESDLELTLPVALNGLHRALRPVEPKAAVG